MEGQDPRSRELRRSAPGLRDLLRGRGRERLNLLLDTHAFIWWLGDSSRLGRQARAAIGASDSLVFVSAASAWEMAVKRRAERLESPSDVPGAVIRCGFLELPITIAHAVESAQLPWHHRDPFDRILIAQARTESLALVAADDRFRAYDVEILDAAA